MPHGRIHRARVLHVAADRLRAVIAERKIRVPRRLRPFRCVKCPRSRRRMAQVVIRAHHQRRLLATRVQRLGKQHACRNSRHRPEAVDPQPHRFAKSWIRRPRHARRRVPRPRDLLPLRGGIDRIIKRPHFLAVRRVQNKPRRRRHRSPTHCASSARRSQGSRTQPSNRPIFLSMGIERRHSSDEIQTSPDSGNHGPAIEGNMPLR